MHRNSYKCECYRHTQAFSTNDLIGILEEFSYQIKLRHKKTKPTESRSRVTLSL